VEYIKQQNGQIEKIEEYNGKDNYTGVVMKLTEALLHDWDSSGGINDDKDVWKNDCWNVVKKRTSNRSSTSQISFSDQLRVRDLQKCRIHQNSCKETKLIAGHIIPVNGNNCNLQHDILFSLCNGVLWCDKMESCYSKYLFCIDPYSGEASFSAEFPYEEANINKNVKYTVVDFTQDLSLDPTNVTQPRRSIVLKYHDAVYIPQRISLYQKYRANKQKKYVINVVQLLKIFNNIKLIKNVYYR